MAETRKKNCFGIRRSRQAVLLLQLWWNLCTFYLLACQVGLTWAIQVSVVVSLVVKRSYFPLFVDPCKKNFFLVTLDYKQRWA